MARDKELPPHFTFRHSFGSGRTEIYRVEQDANIPDGHVMSMIHENAFQVMPISGSEWKENSVAFMRAKEFEFFKEHPKLLNGKQ